jgi:hypothetical protein
MMQQQQQQQQQQQRPQPNSSFNNSSSSAAANVITTTIVKRYNDEQLKISIANYKENSEENREELHKLNEDLSDCKLKF